LAFGVRPSKKAKKGDRPLFSGTIPFSPFVKKDRDCPSSSKKGPVPFFQSGYFFLILLDEEEREEERDEELRLEDRLTLEEELLPLRDEDTLDEEAELLRDDTDLELERDEREDDLPDELRLTADDLDTGAVDLLVFTELVFLASLLRREEERDEDELELLILEEEL
jgi:hypothetical protein